MSEALNEAITTGGSKKGKRKGIENPSAVPFKIPDGSRIGPPTLRVKDLDKMLPFYQGVFGLEVNSRREKDGLEMLYLGTNKTSGPLLILKQDKQVKQPPHNFAGLFHYAVLVPDRKSLGHAFLALQRRNVEFEGFADHLVSESLYLHDPEKNGIEIYRDRPKVEWPRDFEGHIKMDTLPLDLPGILRELPDKEEISDLSNGAFPNGARIGHMHLRVTNLERSVEFYSGVLGFHITADWSAFGAMFLAANGYHHHIGLNTWHSLDGSVRSRKEMGLDDFTIHLSKDDSYIRTLESRFAEVSSTKAIFEKIEVEKGIGLSDPDGIQINITEE